MTLSRRRLTTTLVAGVLAAAAVAVGFSGSALQRNESRPVYEPAPDRAHAFYVTGLGDSVLTGYGSGGATLLTMGADTMAAELKHVPVVDNFASNGATSQDAVDALAAPGVKYSLSRADLVVITVGANDFTEPDAEPGQCPDNTCWDEELATSRARIEALVRMARQQAPRAAVVVTGYWNVFLDGKVADDEGSNYVRDSTEFTAKFNEAVRTIAVTNGAIYLDFRGAMHGDDGRRDPTNLLADDGDHPNVEGQRALAEKLVAVVREQKAMHAADLSTDELIALNRQAGRE